MTNENQIMELCETAWGIIANAGGGNWTLESREWRDAAAQWRGEYFALLDQQEAKRQAEWDGKERRIDNSPFLECQPLSDRRQARQEGGKNGLVPVADTLIEYAKKARRW